MIKLALEAFGLAGVLTKFAIIGGLVATVTIAGGVWYHHIWSNGSTYGYDKALKDIATQDNQAIATARKYRAVVLDCRARGLQYDQTSGKCSGG